VATEADVDVILVGDSVAMVVLGYDDTMQVTVDDLVYHTGAVARSGPTALLVTDLPWLSFHLSTVDTITNAARLIRAGARAVKMEGGSKRVPMIEALVAAEIPVMGHIGLTPQSSRMMGGFRVQGKEADQARWLVDEAGALERAGCFAMVIEGVPDVVGTAITDAVGIPTIGIGAGAGTDGQVLVYHDVIGLENRFKPKFVRRYGFAYADQVSALSKYAADVRSGGFPGPDETSHASDELSDAISLYGSRPAD
jgi:3-methyl-2-oxobutanoate hydroxymethyltransferase